MEVKLLLALFLCSAFIPIGCGKSRPDTDAGSPAPPVVESRAPLTDDEVKTFALRMEKAAREQDRAAYRAGLRIDDLLERGTVDLGMTQSERFELLATARTGSHRVGDDILDSINNGGSYKLLRLRKLNGKPSAVFRLIDNAGSPNYHEIVIVRHTDGVVAAEDLHNMAGGEPISQSLRRLVVMFVGGRRDKSAGQFGGKDREFVDHMPQLQQMTSGIQDGKFEDALRVYRQLPLALQTNKLIQLKAVTAAAGVSEQEHSKELERFRASHPADPALTLLLLNFYSARNDLPHLLETITSVDTFVGGDPFLDCVRAMGFLKSEKFVEARRAADAAIAAEPTLDYGHFAAAVASAAQQDYAATLKYYQQAVEQASARFEVASLKSDPTLVGFCGSPQYEELQRWYAARTK